MSDERSSAGSKDSESEISNKTSKRCETSSDLTSRKQQRSGLTVKLSSSSRHSPRKRRIVHEISSEDLTVSETYEKTNLELSPTTVFRSLNLQPKDDTSAQPHSLDQALDAKAKQIPPSSTSQRSRSHSKQKCEEVLVQPREQATCQAGDTTEIKGSTSGTSVSDLAENYLHKLSNLKDDDLLHGDEDGDTILHLATVHNNIDLARATMSAMVRRKKRQCKGIDIRNKLQQTALHLAVLTCQPSIVTDLVRHGADVNAADRNGHTALHLACKNADVEDIRALREGMCNRSQTIPEDGGESIEVNLRNFEGLAPIHLATLSGSCEVIDQLLDMGADIDRKDSKSGRTALHHAVEANNPIVTRVLLTKGADVNAQTFAGNTPLHAASGLRMENIIHILLEFGADRELTNFEGDLPLPETYMPYSVIRQIQQRSKEMKPK